MRQTDVFEKQRSAALDKLSSATADNRLSSDAACNISRWLTEPRYADFAAEVVRHVLDDRWKTLEEVFWTTIPFGTAGRRGRMYPIGCNAINDRTMGETVQATATYVSAFVRRQGDAARLTCAIGYDTRHRSRHFAELSAEIMLANDFEVYFLDGPRATPLLSTTIRHLGCACGIMITASHNPPSDNAAKVFWATGTQLRAPHDAAVTRGLDQVETIIREPFLEACRVGRVHFCQDELQLIYENSVLDQGFPAVHGRRDLNILFSPMHGVGAGSIVPVLAADGFQKIEVFAPHAKPDGDFPNVPDQIANPESPAVFGGLIEHAREHGHDLILASDPDADRIGCAAPVTMGSDEWATLTGNQIGVLLAEYVLQRRSAAGTLTPKHYLIKTLVTTDMYLRLGAAYNVTIHGACLTGFKWIGSLIDELGPDEFVMGTEEAHGYLLGTYARDKDAAVAAMLLAELADEARANQQTLHDCLVACFRKYGCHQEKTLAKVMPGADGMERMQSIMQQFRAAPPGTIAGMKLVEIRDYLTHTITAFGQPPRQMDGPELDLPASNLIVLRWEGDQAWIAIRPSGTEPKIKFYCFTNAPADASADVIATNARLQQRLAEMATDLWQHAETAN